MNEHPVVAHESGREHLVAEYRSGRPSPPHPPSSPHTSSRRPAGGEAREGAGYGQGKEDAQHSGNERIAEPAYDLDEPHGGRQYNTPLAQPIDSPKAHNKETDDKIGASPKRVDTATRDTSASVGGASPAGNMSHPHPGQQSQDHQYPTFEHQPMHRLPAVQHFESLSAQPIDPYTSSSSAHPPPPPLNSSTPYAQPSFASYPNGGVQSATVPSSVGTTNGQSSTLRYPLPPASAFENRQMPGSRHKKEIKRRTKTGCLTCRKRRIKCDEGHPACRNCTKSKRECLGYDPIFKSHTSPPSLESAPVLDTPTLSSKPQHPYQPLPPYSSVGGVYLPAGNTELSYDYPPPLDPALAGREASFAMAQPSYPPASQLLPQRTVKHLDMDDLFAINDVPPSFQQAQPPASIPAASQQDVADFYTFHYAAGLDRLLETDWYSRFGLEQLRQDARTLDFVSQCIERFKTRADDLHATNAIRSLEARLVWQLAALCRSNPANQNLMNRLDTLEHLLTCQFLHPSRIPMHPSSPQFQSNQPPEKYNEQSFWHHLGHFVSIRDDTPDPNIPREIATDLAAMFGNLGMLETRDVLYSIAVARHVGGRMPDFHPQRHIVATTNDPNDEVNKLKVAHHFVEAEDQRGSSQVIQRICSMALRSWALQKR